MDAYEVYLNTLKYVMNADPDDRTTWNEIFKYLPCLHQMLLCCVCGNLLKCPQGPFNGVCLHHVCHGCLGGKMRLKPSCSWCKDPDDFTENKKLRILVLCFKRLCAYISNSKLGSEILKQSADATDGLSIKDPELTRHVLQDAEQFTDDFALSSPPRSMTLPKLIKSSRGLDTLSSSLLSKPSTSRGSDSGIKAFGSVPKGNVTNRGRGRRRKNHGKIPLKPNQSSTSLHIKRLKRKALHKSPRPNVSTKKFPLKTFSSSGRFMKRNSSSEASGLLVAQRPHRELSGKFSVGQLWRETFLEERPPEPEIYPDSGIEVGNSSDQDHGSQPPILKHENEPEKAPATSDSQESIVHVRDTRLHPAPESNEAISENFDSRINYGNRHKPRLTLTISKRQLSKTSRKGHRKSSAHIRDPTELPLTDFADRLPSKLLNITRRGLKAGTDRSLTKRRDICRCARFKQPNRLTCFGQKCPCYRDRKACVDCLCNGCKNPRRKGDCAPSLMHVISENSCGQHAIDPSMPRLSPIPRM